LFCFDLVKFLKGSLRSASFSQIFGTTLFVLLRFRGCESDSEVVRKIIEAARLFVEAVIVLVEAVRVIVEG
jgi:hypothetical protein